MKHFRFVHFMLVFIIATLSLSTVLPAGAQANTLSYGSSALGQISPQIPLAFYIFNGATNDAISARVIGLTEGFDPVLTMLAPDQSQVGSNDNDPLAQGGDSRISTRLPANGVYTLLVGGMNGSTGDYVLVLDGRSGIFANPLSGGQSALADFTISPSAQYFNAVADSAASIILSLTAQPATFPFAAEVRDPDGNIVASLAGLPQYALTLPAGQGNYEIMIMPANAELLGAVQVALGGSTLPPAPLATSEVSNIPAPAGVCTVSTGGAVNVRSGPGTGFGIIGTLQPGNFPQVSGISSDRGWYAINFNGQTGWVSGTVSTLNGPCDNLPVVQSSTSPQVPATLPPGVTPTVGAPAATQEVNQPGVPTATQPLAPTQPDAPTQPPPTEPPPPTQPVYQTAPPDNDVYTVNLDRDAGGQFSDVISYSGGDTTDRLAVRVSNFDSINTFRQFTATMVCSGTNPQALRWGLNIQENLVCGQNVTFVLTNESNNQFINITLPSGSPEGSYVPYTVIFTRIG